MKKDSASSPRFPKRRSLARLAAVQALYQVFFRGEKPSGVIYQYAQNEVAEDNLIPSSKSLDILLFSQLVEGVFEKKEILDDLIKKNLSHDWPFERMDPLVISILRCGIFETLYSVSISPAVIISEYLEVGHAFCDEKVTKFIHGFLDSMARTLRN